MPQAADQNQGPWAQFENHLGDFARLQDREVYVITGVAGNKGTLKDEGKVVIPTHTWKVALILPRDQGLADVRDYRDVQVLAVIMPNEPGVRNVPWETYLTNVDAVEVLERLRPARAAGRRSRERRGVGHAAAPRRHRRSGAAASPKVVPRRFSAGGSVDPNGSINSYAWDFGDGSSGEGVSVSHVYAPGRHVSPCGSRSRTTRASPTPR